MGRWSRPVARVFVDWLQPAPGLRWLELGCGTGALTGEILGRGEPEAVVATEPAAVLLALARAAIPDPRVTFVVSRADALPPQVGPLDLCVSGLVLNFINEPEVALTAIASRLDSGGTIAAYVWDYAGEMQLLRVFWDVAAQLDPAAAALDEGRRFPICAPGPLRALFEAVGLERVSVVPLDMVIRFADFDDYWQPLLGGTGPAPAYVAMLAPRSREALAGQLRQQLVPAGDGPFELVARAWAVRGSRAT